MPRLDTNRAAEMEVFVRVVDLGGFTAAAREFRLTPSGVSKLVSRLGRRVNSNIPFGMRHIMPLVPAFLAQHPEITLDLVFSDTVVDLMQERADVAIRVGPLRDSALIARKLGASRMSVVATPEYLARSGIPANPGDLARHKGIGWTFFRTIGGAPFPHRQTNGA